MIGLTNNLIQIIRFFAVVFAVVFCAAICAANPFADSVVSYSPGPGQWVSNPLYNDPSKALGRPYGVNESTADNTSVATLGDGGSLTLAFNQPVTDDAANPGGYDFIVFSNAIFVGGNPAFRWQEPAFVEISQDGTTWYLILPNILPSALIGGVDTGQSATILRNYAEYTPTLALPQERFPPLAITRSAEEFYTFPDRQSFAGDDASLQVDPTSGGGDAFDIADAVCESSPGVPSLDSKGNIVPASIAWFRYIRMTDAIVGDRIKVGPYDLGEVSAEIDAVADIAPAISVGAARRLPLGSYVAIWGAKVSAAFTGEVWIEQADRSAGIRVATDATIEEGDGIAVTGHIASQNGEKYVSDSLVTVLSHGMAPSPVALSNPFLGTDLASGLLVSVWGKRTEVGDDWFGIKHASGNTMDILCGLLNQMPDEDQFVMATGILTHDSYGKLVIRTRRGDDIKTEF